MKISRVREWIAILTGIFVLCGCSGATDQVDDPSGAGPGEPVADQTSVEPVEEDAGMRTSEPPTNRPGSATVGSLPRAVIRKVVGARMGEITSCYERLALEKGSDAQGVVEVKMIIGVDGRVTMASISDTTLEHEPTERCITDVIRETVFPPPDGAGVVVVTYPFELTFE